MKDKVMKTDDLKWHDDEMMWGKTMKISLLDSPAEELERVEEEEE